MSTYKITTTTRWALFAGLLCISADVLAAPPPPAGLTPDIQGEFTRLYDLPDPMLALQLGPMLDAFPEYRSQLIKYLAQGASPERKEMLAEESKGTKQELASWFDDGNHKVIATAAVLATATAVLLADHSGGGHHDRESSGVSPIRVPPVVITPPPVVVTPPKVTTPPVVTPPKVTTPPVVTPPTVTTPPAVVTPAPVVPTPPAATPPSITTSEPEDPSLIITAPTFVPVVTREDFRTQEFDNTQTLNAIHADYAYARGGTGKGVIISVQDVDQVNTNNPELVNQIAPGSVLGGVEGHGTAVARTAVGEKNDENFQGVAFDSKLLTHWNQNDDQVVDSEIANGARISNHSYTIDVTTQQFKDSDGATYLKGANAGIVYVWAAGNTLGAPNPSDVASLPLLMPELKGNWIAVVAVNLNIDWQNSGNATASDIQGNACGNDKDFCMAAPGFGFQTISNGGASFTTGSSLAAPTVSGALAVLMQLFPTLTTQQIVQRVFTSADKTGIYADSSIYGQGLLNLDAATQPIGALAIETSTGRIVPLSQAAIAEGTAMGTALRTSLSKVNLVLKDSLDAPFTVSGSALSASAPAQLTRIDTGAYLERYSEEYRTDQITTPGGMRLNYSGGDGSSGLSGLGHAQAWKDMGNGLAISAGMNTNPSWSQGLLGAQPQLKNASVTEAFNNPYLSISEQASGAGVHWQLAKNWQTSVQANVGKAPERLDNHSTGDQQQSVQAEWGYAGPSGLTASVQLGYLNEQNRLLGTESEGLIGGGGTRTFFNGVNLGLPLNESWRLFGRYNSGTSQLHGSGWADSATLRSNSFTLGSLFEATPRLQLGALAYQPMRVSGGAVATHLPTGLASDNSVTWSKVNLGAAPDGRHMEYEAFLRYKVPITGLDLNVKSSLLHIQDYDNQAGNNDNLLMFSAGLRY